MQIINCTEDNILFVWQEELKLTSAGGIALPNPVKRETRWAKAKIVGPKSKIQPRDELLLSARPTTFKFKINGEAMENTGDRHILAFKRNGTLNCTGKTLLVTYIDNPEEERTESGLVIISKEINKEMEVRAAFVHATGPETGVKPGDTVYVPYNKDSYKLEIDGIKMTNIGAESIVYFQKGDGWRLKPYHIPGYECKNISEMPYNDELGKTSSLDGER